MDIELQADVAQADRGDEAGAPAVQRTRALALLVDGVREAIVDDRDDLAQRGVGAAQGFGPAACPCIGGLGWTDDLHVVLVGHVGGSQPEASDDATWGDRDAQVCIGVAVEGDLALDVGPLSLGVVHCP